jgi:hypothetical protein
MDTGLLVLHGLAVRKAGTVEQVCAVLGEPRDIVQGALDEAQTRGEVIGAKGTYMPTPAGRTRLDGAYADSYADVRADPSFVEAADRFEVINKKLLALLTRWQAVPQGGTTVPNDHSDEAYDTGIIDELGDLHERAEKVLAAFTVQIPRYAAYEKRLSDAYDAALAGDTDYVSGVQVDSYHTVWHELHEDLLRVLGRTRQE